jgi:HSP20 family protein
MTTLQQLLSNGISMIETDPYNRVSNVLCDFLHTQDMDIYQNYQLPVDIVETSSHVSIYINTPGIQKDSIDVDFFNNKIIITGERKKPFIDTVSIIKNEINYGKFRRQITIPISVTNRDSVKITCKNGVLTILINKEREEQNRFSLRLGSNSQN